ARQRPDLILSDLHLPVMTGHEMCRRLKADPTLQHIPIILSAKFSTMEEILLGLESGADSCVLQPYEEGQVLRTVLALLHTPWSADTQARNFLLAMCESILNKNNALNALQAGQQSECLAHVSHGYQLDPEIRQALAERCGARVLLVDDHDINQQIACELLGQVGLAVSVANDGLQAVELVRQNRYDLVLMDRAVPRETHHRAQGDSERAEIIVWCHMSPYT
ncbi:MAG: response regulator, partial [Planctomycetota bacterium]|nr:response regulator [Planctomycetota bacterium]